MRYDMPVSDESQSQNRIIIHRFWVLFKGQFTSNGTAIILLPHDIILWDGLYGSHTVVFITQQTTLIQSNTGLL